MNTTSTDWTPTPLEISLALVVVLTDKFPEEGVDAAFIHGGIQDKYLDEQLLAVVAKKYLDGKIKTIVINGISEVECRKNNVAYSGSEPWVEFMVVFGVKREDIICATPSLHTATETSSFLELAKERNWTKLVICSQPHHQLRCFLQIVAIMEKMNFWPDVFNLTYSGIPWKRELTKTLLGTGIIKGTLSDMIDSEYQRVVKYAQTPTQNADGKMSHMRHATIPEMLIYLDRRKS